MMGPDLSRREWLGQMALGAAGVGPAVSAPPSAPVDGARVYNIRDFGAKGDGATLDTAAVQAAIDACTRDGGGTVLVPAGVFHVGSLELKSNVTLYLVASATLLGSAQIGDERRQHVGKLLRFARARNVCDNAVGGHYLYARTRCRRLHQRDGACERRIERFG